MYAKITKDYLDLTDTLGPEYNRTGKVLLSGYPVGRVFRCRLYDDDNELYYEAEADDGAFESLYEWALIDAGATILRVLKDGKWEDVIS